MQYEEQNYNAEIQFIHSRFVIYHVYKIRDDINLFPIGASIQYKHTCTTIMGHDLAC